MAAELHIAHRFESFLYKIYEEADLNGRRSQIVLHAWRLYLVWFSAPTMDFDLLVKFGAKIADM